MTIPSTNLVRRRFLQLAAIAAPVTALGAWGNSRQRHAVWTADGQLQFFSAPDGIHWASADGTRSGLLLALGTGFALTPGSVTPGAGHLAYSALDRRTGSNIWTVPLRLHDGQPSAGMPAAFFHSGAFDVNPRFSADGKRLAYASREDRRWNLRVRDFA